MEELLAGVKKPNSKVPPFETKVVLSSSGSNWVMVSVAAENLGKNKDGFKKFSNVKAPDTERSWVNASMTLEECKHKCTENCSCMAYANSDIRGEGSGCAIWFGDLLDIRLMSNAGQDLYIRLAMSETGMHFSIGDVRENSTKSWQNI